MSERQGYDKNKKHKIATYLSGEQMDSAFERRRDLGITSNSEYIRRLILDDVSDDSINLRDLQHIRERLSEANERLSDTNAELDYYSDKVKNHAKTIRQLEINCKESHDNLASMNSSRDKWMNAFLCLENAVFGNVEDIDNINQFDKDSVPGISDERVVKLKNRVLAIIEDGTIRKEVESQVKNKERDIQGQWIIIGKMEDAIVSGEIETLFDIDLDSDRKQKMIDSIRAFRKTVKEGKEAISNIEKPSFGFAIRLVWKSIFK